MSIKLPFQLSGALESPEWHKEILDERRKKVADGTAKFQDWETAKADIRKKLRRESEDLMKANLKRENSDPEEGKSRIARAIPGAKTETDASNTALNLVTFEKEILKSLEKVARKGGVEKIFQ
jgi:hypothetical protein